MRRTDRRTEQGWDDEGGGGMARRTAAERIDVPETESGRRRNAAEYQLHSATEAEAAAEANKPLSPSQKRKAERQKATSAAVRLVR